MNEIRESMTFTIYLDNGEAQTYIVDTEQPFEVVPDSPKIAKIVFHEHMNPQAAIDGKELQGSEL